MKLIHDFWDYTFERHQNCPHFFQNSWEMGEGKYECEMCPDEILYLEEIPENCIKGFKAFHYPEPPKMIEDKSMVKDKPKCKIYQFKLKNK